MAARSLLRQSAQAVIAVLFGYAFLSGMVALAGVLLPYLIRIDAAEAVLLGMILGFPSYIAIIAWAFHAQSIWRVSLTLGLCALLMIGGAQALAPPGSG